MDPSIYRLRQQDVLTFCVLALLALGLVMVQSASMGVTGKLSWQWTPMGSKQFMFCIVGLITYFSIGRYDYTRLSRASTVWWKHPIVCVLAVTAFLNLIVLVPHI